MEYYLAKVGELSLKGGNKKTFEQKLINNFSALSGNQHIKATVHSGRMYVECEKEECEVVEKTLSHLI